MDRWVADDDGGDDRDRDPVGSWDDLDALFGPDPDPDPDGHPDRDGDGEIDPVFGRDDDLSAVSFDDRYDPDVLAAIEARSAAPDPEPVSKLSQWTRRSAVGAVFTGMALGLQEVFDPEEERSIVIEVDDQGLPNDLPVQMILDPDSPAGSLCIVHRSDVPPPVV